MVTARWTRGTRTLVAAASLTAAGMMSGCGETEQPAPGTGAGSEQATSSPEQADGFSEASSTDLGAYSADVRDNLSAYSGQQVTMTGEVSELIRSRSSYVIVSPQDPESDPLLISARYAVPEIEEGSLVEVTGIVRENFTPPVVEEATEGDEEVGFYDRHVGEPYLDEAELGVSEPSGQ